MSYIDVDKFAEKICNFQEIDENAANAMIWLLRTFPTADVVEVVRCKDCKHYTIEENDVLGICNCGYPTRSGGIFPWENHYCSYGERRKNAVT